MISISELSRLALTVFIGSLGALFGVLAGLPAPFLCGPALAVTGASLLGLTLSVPKNLRSATFVIVGVSMGTNITPNVFEAARAWPLSFVAVLLTVVVLLYAAYWILHFIFRYDHTTAMLGASPGHLSYIISLTAETKSDLATVSVIQSVRVLALTLTVPLIVKYLDLVSVEPSILPPPMPALELGLTLLVSLAVGLVFMRWRFPAALLLGGVAVSIGSHVTGFSSGGVPDWLAIPTYIVLGSLIGTRFSRSSLKDMRKAFLAGAVVTVAVVVLACSIAVLVSSLTGVPLNAVMIAFAPGGLETMAAMAVMMHADTAYVGSHHVLRLLFLSVLMPFVIGKQARGR
ncbi:AbrB family transcriptional regulator [Agrobacterium sp. CNPSo 3708]|uniref:AbrB family transcriptional regulator n=1 Tax=Agrobacterium sp. CNPSo 3708 TaxID=3028150 RepID=UPI002363CE4D|nr:AbrB family transcriptional regulator [Agrobacterium sp. CNPSo 3708]MDD1497360.1 AbrB family transcriptional regulator [Agrobacterium sp. CNPSo 3708]